MDTILTGEKVESSIVGGVRVLINLLGQKITSHTKNSETFEIPFSNVVEDAQRHQLASIIIPYLKIFNQLLLHPPNVSKILIFIQDK